MKKLLSLALALVLVLGLSVPAFAAETNDGKNDTSIDVKAIYSGGVSTPDVIAVNVEWGAMSFTYNVSGTKEWDSVNHKYVDKSVASWTASGNTVTVTNHSNVAITAALSFTADENYSGITGSFDNAELKLPSAVNKATTDETLVGTAKLTLDGNLSSSTTTSTKVGTISVKITKQ